MTITNSRTIGHVLLTIITLLLQSSAVNGFFFGNRCPDTERCFFGLFVLMRDVIEGTNQCTEFCVLFQDPALECGRCDLGTDPIPAPSPSNPIPTPPTSSSQYDISLSLSGIPSIDQRVFEDAARRWESVIVGDLPSVSRSSLFYDLDSSCSVPLTIDDLHICARYEPIDGSLRVLGYAGPYDTRSNSLSITGEMAFDSADIGFLKEQGNFESVILHEIGHILGIGTLWEDTGTTGSFNCPYRGRNARAEFTAISGCGTVPTEQDGGSGTRCGHWDDECMQNELMTGFVNSGNNPLSRITVASLQDIGYRVDYSSADAYTADNLNPNCRCRRSKRTLRSTEHGSIHQHDLFPSSKGTQRRRLSDEMYNTAISFGEAKLAKRKEERQKGEFGTLFSNMKDGNTVDVNIVDSDPNMAAVKFSTREFITVFVMENNTFYDVVVRSEE